MPETDTTAATAAKSTGGAKQLHGVRPGTQIARQRQRQSVIRGSGRQVDSEIEAGSPVKHDGQDSERRTEKTDVDPRDVRGNEQPARAASQGETNPLDDVRPPADGGAVVPWVRALDHLL